MFGGIPFEHFAQGGGMPSGRGGGDVDTTKLYETLELTKDASQKDIKKAYFRLSKIHHPDKGGDEHQFKEIAAAYEILSDPEKRKAYDKYGLEGVSDGAPSAGGEDLFSMFFGGGRSHRSRGPRKGPSTNHPLSVSLEDIYNGKTVKLAVTRKVIVGDVKTCSDCDGRGMKMEIRQLGPGMIQQMQTTCPKCKGQGNMAETKSERKVLEVHIEKGAKDGQKISFKGAGDEMPGMEPGDINFIVKIKEHSQFVRRGADLLVQKKISLAQALTGFRFKVTHLDGRKLVIKSKPGEIIQPEATDSDHKVIPFSKCIPQEGMPSLGNPFVKGNLYVVFRVEFPTDNTFSDEQIKVLKSILPDPDMGMDEDDNDDEEVFYLSPANVTHFGSGGASNHGSDQSYDSDEEDGPRPVQCQQS
jgi:DnaJ family protein A protein 2